MTNMLSNLVNISSRVAQAINSHTASLVAVDSAARQKIGIRLDAEQEIGMDAAVEQDTGNASEETIQSSAGQQQSLHGAGAADAVVKTEAPMETMPAAADTGAAAEDANDLSLQAQAE